jgi:hypothetical protein
MTDLINLQQVGHWVEAGVPSANAVSATTSTKIWVGAHSVGEVCGEEFIKKVRGSKHFLRKPPAIAFDISSLEEAKACGATTVRAIDDETGKVYQVPISTIFSKGFIFDRGHGSQIGLVFRYWQQGNDPLATQLGLWGEVL